MPAVDEADLKSQANFREQGSDRQTPRYVVDLAISADSEHNFIAATATNLSATGLFIATPIVHPIGTELRVTMAIGATGEVVRGTGIVRWCRATENQADEPMGIGIELMSLDDGGQERIEEFLQKRTPMARSDFPPAD